MAHIIDQTVSQYGTNGLPQRMIVQYKDDVTGEELQVIVDRDSLNAAEQQIFDDYKALAESKMT